MHVCSYRVNNRPIVLTIGLGHLQTHRDVLKHEGPLPIILLLINMCQKQRYAKVGVSGMYYSLNNIYLSRKIGFPCTTWIYFSNLHFCNPQGI